MNNSTPGASLRVAIVGKGGSGKSTISGTLCRILAHRGHKVLALDADNVPGLAYTIGVEAPGTAAMSKGAVFVEKQGWEAVVTAREAVEHFSARGPDGIRFLQFRKLEGTFSREQQASVRVFLNVAADFDQRDWFVVIDLAAGPRQAYQGWSKKVRKVLVVVEPSVKSFFTARRLVRYADKRKKIQLLGVANKVAGARHRRMIQEELDKLNIPYWAEVPADPAVAEAEKHGRPVIDTAPRSKGVKAIERIAEQLLLI